MAKEATQDGRAKNFLSFWSTLPGVLTAAATFITAVTGLLVYLHSTPDPPTNKMEPVVTTSLTTPPASNPTTTSAPSSPTTVSTKRDLTIPTLPRTTSSSPPPTATTAAGCTAFDTMNSTLITLSPDRAPKGAEVKVTGSGFCPGDLIDFKVHTSNAGSVTTDGKGGFVSTITVPPDAPSSGFSTDISANSRTNRGYASAPFTMG